MAIFIAMGTQWRATAGGVTGLDYTALREVMRFRQVPRSSWPQLFDDVRLLEAGALGEIHKRDK